jgi:2-alkenal reductase
VIVDANGNPVRRLADLTDQLEPVGVGKSVGLKVQSGGTTKIVRVEVTDIGRTQS